MLTVLLPRVHERVHDEALVAVVGSELEARAQECVAGLLRESYVCA